MSLIVASDDQLFALPLGEREVEWEIKLSKERAWERFATLSQVAVLEGEEREVSILSGECVHENDFTDVACSG